jgi:hypothetical protein
VELYLHYSNTTSRHGAQLRGNYTFTFFLQQKNAFQRGTYISLYKGKKTPSNETFISTSIKEPRRDTSILYKANKMPNEEIYISVFHKINEAVLQSHTYQPSIKGPRRLSIRHISATYKKTELPFKETEISVLMKETR